LPASLSPSASSKAIEYFDTRVSGIAVEHQPFLLMQYANVLRNRLELGLSSPDSDFVQIKSR